MFYISQIVWVVFLFFVVDQKIASFINGKFQVFRWFYRSNNVMLLGIVIFFIVLFAISAVILLIFGDNLSTSYLKAFIGFTVLALVGGTVFRVFFNV